MNPKLYHLRQVATGFAFYAIKKDGPALDKPLVIQYPFQGWWANAKALILAGCKLGQVRDMDWLNIRQMDSLTVFEVNEELLEAIKAQNRIPRRPNKNRRLQAFKALAKLIQSKEQPNDETAKPVRVTADTKQAVQKTLRREVGKINSLFVDWEAERKAEDLAYKTWLKAMVF